MNLLVISIFWDMTSESNRIKRASHDKLKAVFMRVSREYLAGWGFPIRLGEMLDQFSKKWRPRGILGPRKQKKIGNEKFGWKNSHAKLEKRQGVHIRRRALPPGRFDPFRFSTPIKLLSEIKLERDRGDRLITQSQVPTPIFSRFGHFSWEFMDYRGNEGGVG